MENKYSDSNKVFEIVKNFYELLFTKERINKKVRIERINEELLINSKETLYKHLQK